MSKIFSMQALNTIKDVLQKYNSNPSALIQILNEIQEAEGFLPRDLIDTLSTELNIPLSKIYGVITFYEHYKLTKPGKHIVTACMGTACFVKSAKLLLQTLEIDLGIKSGETTEDGLFSVEQVACLGCCALAPVIQIDGEVHGQMTPAKLQKLINKILKEENEGSEEKK